MLCFYKTKFHYYGKQSYKTFVKYYGVPQGNHIGQLHQFT